MRKFNTDQETKMIAMRAGVRFYWLFLPLFCSCSHRDKVYTSDCNNGHEFVHVTINSLTDSAEFYNNKFVEVSGKFAEGKTMSVLTGDKKGRPIMVEFSAGCPLFLQGTRIGFFDYDNNSGQLTPANNKTVTIKGEVVVHVKGKANQPKVSVAHISYVRF